ncbi:sulfite oxidase [Rugosibacter aromaticivorans]|uniref:Protein-methionine-sulfoxide reductase heme-binding subunit MsrQ n=1 Tax=Rugosibacter aromaticivorans TaxID=1565605 RepID=A0A0C5IYM7_9PROT|nr:sulfite oxidase [Rugosibacter aromaticivorans]TBR16057.1 MAG: sulfoxide reductase heme-binding subunit YedZ [Rugosibacter sp.]
MLLRPHGLKLNGLKLFVFTASLAPLGWYAWGIQTDNLGANPIEAVTRGLGTWALNFLLITLAATPLRHYAGWTWPLIVRRMLGLFAFFYASLHLTTYLWFDQFFDWLAIGKDIFKRPFITVGMTTFLLLIPLAATSNARAIRKLGGRRWQQLHRMVYLCGALAVLHYTWMVKADIRKPLIYWVILTALLSTRMVWQIRKAQCQQFRK